MVKDFSYVNRETLKKIKYNEETGCYEPTSAFLEVIGNGKRATVFKVKNEKIALKIFHPDHLGEALKEIESYSLLKEENPYFVQMHGYGENYIVIDYVEGRTLSDCLVEGIEIPEEVIHKVDEAIEYARGKGLNPSDIHIKNVIWDGENLKVIDLEGFLRKGKCRRWRTIKRNYYQYYLKSWFPKKLPVGIINFSSNFYRKAELLTGFKQKR